MAFASSASSVLTMTCAQPVRAQVGIWNTTWLPWIHPRRATRVGTVPGSGVGVFPLDSPTPWVHGGDQDVEEEEGGGTLG